MTISIEQAGTCPRCCCTIISTVVCGRDDPRTRGRDRLDAADDRPRRSAGWFTRGAETGDLLQYLATFEHTLAVMQTADSIERVAYEAAVDLAADGVVYAEVRFAPELHDADGLALEPWSKR